MDAKFPHIKKRDTPKWGLYQRNLFWKYNEGEVPQFNTHPDKLEELASKKLSQNGWLYASSNAGLSHTHLANSQALFRHKLMPRQLVDTNERPTRTSLFNENWEVSAPIGIAPVGINKIYHDRGELGLVYSLSTAGSYPIEDVGRANDEGRKNRFEANRNLGDDGNQHNKAPEAPRFFQLYMPHDDEPTLSLLKRAHESGFEACILTKDTPQLGWRHDDVATSNYAFYRGIGGGSWFHGSSFSEEDARERGGPEPRPREGGDHVDRHHLARKGVVVEEGG